MEAGDIYLENEKNVYESPANTASRWFSRFMMEKRRRMVVVRGQDEALTVDKLLLMGDIAEEDWLKSNSEEEKKELELTTAFTTVAFCVSFRGEEVPLIVI